jgi:uncharacterized membrane protein YgcG
MDQRRLRLGDILDDYCPRERRVTNHAVVAMVEEDVKQTRCTTCDAEHVYKGGKAPRRKKSESTGALYKEVLAGITDQESVPATAEHPMPASHDDRDAGPGPANVDEPVSVARSETPAAQIEDDEPQPAAPVDEGPVHRPLIRAQLPRPEGVKIERQAPEFTIRQNGGRGGNGNFRGGMHAAGRGGAGTNGGGHRFGRGPNRSGGRGASQGFGRGPGPGQPRGPRKRSR